MHYKNTFQAKQPLPGLTSLGSTEHVRKFINIILKLYQHTHLDTDWDKYMKNVKKCQKTLYQGKIPDDWRQALIAPIHKAGNKNKTVAENYRPVSLTTVTCKVLEHIIHSHIISHLDRHNVLHDNQYGFRRKRSCETQLLKTVHDLAKTLNDKGQTDSILLHFSKAFDKVCHRNYY